MFDFHNNRNQNLLLNSYMWIQNRHKPIDSSVSINFVLLGRYFPIYEASVGPLTEMERISQLLPEIFP